MEKHIYRSLININVGERKVGDAKKVIATGNNLAEEKTNIENALTVDVRKTGKNSYLMINSTLLVKQYLYVISITIY